MNKIKFKKWQLKKFAIVSVILAVMNILMVTGLIIGGSDMFSYAYYILFTNILFWSASIYGVLTANNKKKANA